MQKTISARQLQLLTHFPFFPNSVPLDLLWLLCFSFNDFRSFSTYGVYFKLSYSRRQYKTVSKAQSSHKTTSSRYWCSLARSKLVGVWLLWLSSANFWSSEVLRRSEEKVLRLFRLEGWYLQPLLALFALVLQNEVRQWSRNGPFTLWRTSYDTNHPNFM